MISVIIPIYKEQSVYSILKNFEKKLKKKFKNFEIIIVNNGSDEVTLSESIKFSKKFRCVKNPKLKNPNYGKAIELGLKKSTKSISIILEFDFLNFKFVNKSVKKIVDQNFSLVIGSKTLRNSKDNRGIIRVIMTRVFNILLSFFLKIKSSDTHGLKAISKALRDKILINCKSSSHAYQTEIVLVAEKLNFEIVEIPLEIKETRPTKLNIFYRVFTYLLIIKELHQLKKNYK